MSLLHVVSVITPSVSAYLLLVLSGLAFYILKFPNCKLQTQTSESSTISEIVILSNSTILKLHTFLKWIICQKKNPYNRTEGGTGILLTTAGDSGEPQHRTTRWRSKTRHFVMFPLVLSAQENAFMHINVFFSKQLSVGI